MALDLAALRAVHLPRFASSLASIPQASALSAAGEHGEVDRHSHPEHKVDNDHGPRDGRAAELRRVSPFLVKPLVVSGYTAVDMRPIASISPPVLFQFHELLTPVSLMGGCSSDIEDPDDRHQEPETAQTQRQFPRGALRCDTNTQ